MSNTRLRAADLADEFRSISSDKRMEYVPAQAVHLLIAADMLDANDKMLMRLNAEYLVRQNLAAENDKLRELVRSYHSAMRCMLETGIWPTDPKWLEHRMRELGVVE